MLVALGCLFGAGTAAAQTPETHASTQRADVHAVIGWQNLRLKPGSEAERYENNWANEILFGGAGAGWYWTDHHKTQVDFGAGTPARQYQYEPQSINGQFVSQVSRIRVTRPSFAISQQYQFFRNAWFHPHVGIGIDIARETRTETYEPILVFDNAGRITREIAPQRTEGPDHKVVVRPFAETGFKAYMTRRAFFTTDMRLMFHAGIDQALFRIGFGVDF